MDYTYCVCYKESIKISAWHHITLRHTSISPLHTVYEVQINSFAANLSSVFQPVTHQCWCCMCEQWCRSEAVSSPSLWTPCRRLGNSRPGWLSGSCGCGIGSMLAWAGLEALGCPESGNGNLCMWTRSCGPRNDDSFLGPVAGGRNGHD